jgi:beta-lactamase class D
MSRAAITLLIATLFVSVLIPSPAFAHDKSNQSSLAKQKLDCEVKASDCSMALIRNSTGKIKLANVPNALKRQPAGTSAVLALMTTILEQSDVKAKQVKSGNKSLTLTALNLHAHHEYFKQTIESLKSQEVTQYLGTLRYGNKALYNAEKVFSPESLMISPVEQVKFLRRIIENQQVTQKQTKQSIESMFSFDQSTQLNYLVFEQLPNKNSLPASPSINSRWVMGWHNNASDRAYFVLYQKDKSTWSEKALLAGIKQWLLEK